MPTLNYVIPEELETALEDYSSQTGRPAHDVVRQLVVEFVEGDRGAPEPRAHPTGRRTNVVLPERVLGALEHHVGAAHTSKAALIAGLLEDFLAHRRDPETYLSITIRLPARLLDTITKAYPGPVPEAIVSFIEEAQAVTRERGA